MNNYQLLIPQLSLFCGIIFLGLLQIGREESGLGLQWIVHTFFLLLAFFQEILLYQVPSTTFIKGSLVLDGSTVLLSLAVLLLALMAQWSRLKTQRTLTPQVNILSLGMVLFAVVAIESNRILFSTIAVVGLIWTAHSALAAETEDESQPDIVHSGMIRGILFLLGGVVLTILCFACFGDTQVDEMQRTLVRGNFKDHGLFAIECFVLFLGLLVSGLPPLQGLFGKSRKGATWGLALSTSGFFSIVGFSLIVRWGILVFSRPAIGGLELEAMTPFDFLVLLRWSASAALILVPILALLRRQFRGSLLYFCLNPFAQAAFAISFGQRELMGYVLGQILVAAFTIGLLIAALASLELTADSTFQEWVGLGRRARAPAMTLILAVAAEAGLAPFFGSVLLHKTLSINTYFAIFPILNLAFAGFYVARLVVLAFHRSKPGIAPTPITFQRKLWFAAQLLALILMGIFWQPLYKYGAFSIRSFFGEM